MTNTEQVISADVVFLGNQAFREHGPVSLFLTESPHHVVLLKGTAKEIAVQKRVIAVLNQTLQRLGRNPIQMTAVFNEKLRAFVGQGLNRDQMLGLANDGIEAMALSEKLKQETVHQVNSFERLNTSKTAQKLGQLIQAALSQAFARSA